MVQQAREPEQYMVMAGYHRAGQDKSAGTELVRRRCRRHVWLDLDGKVGNDHCHRVVMVLGKRG